MKNTITNTCLTGTRCSVLDMISLYNTAFISFYFIKNFIDFNMQYEYAFFNDLPTSINVREPENCAVLY